MRKSHLSSIAIALTLVSMGIASLTSAAPFVPTAAGNITDIATSGVPSPLGITIDASQSNIYVASDAGKVIRIALGQTGGVDYAITGGSARGLAFDGSSNLYVANFASGSVQRIAASQTGVVDHVTGITQPYGVAFDGTGNLYISSTNFGNATGGKILKVAVGQTGAVDYVTGLNSPTHLAFDTAGNLYVSSYNGNKIYRVAAGQTGAVDYVTGLPITPIGLTINTAGTIFVGGFGNGGSRLMRIMSGQTTPTTMAIALGTTDLAGVAMGPGVRPYVARYTTNAVAIVDEIPVVTLSGATTVTLTVGDTYSDAGASWTDFEDGSGSTVNAGFIRNSNVSTSTAGSYTVTYTKLDTAGNLGIATRNVTVNAPVVVTPPGGGAGPGGGGGGGGSSSPYLPITTTSTPTDSSLITAVPVRNLIVIEKETFTSVTATPRKPTTLSTPTTLKQGTQINVYRTLQNGKQVKVGTVRVKNGMIEYKARSKGTYVLKQK